MDTKIENKYYTPEIEESKVCKQCKENKLLSNYRKVHSGTGLEGTCRKCAAERTRLYRLKNKEKVREAQRKCYLKKREYYLKQSKKHREKNPDCRKQEYQRIKNNTFKYFRKTIRSRISQAFYSNGWRKNTKAEKILGCNYTTAFKHIEKQFLEGMSWKNKKEWHIDHIIPLSYAKNEEEILKLCNYKNLQPLWATDNLRKNNKITLNKSELKRLLKQLDINE